MFCLHINNTYTHTPVAFAKQSLLRFCKGLIPIALNKGCCYSLEYQFIYTIDGI